MKSHYMKDVLENIARHSVPEDINLWPNISARLERKSQMLTPRPRPVLVILIALLILLALSGVAYAIGLSLGYIPGLGVVEQNAPFRILEKPVSQTRDGITVTVKKAVLNTDQALVVFTVEGMPLDKQSFWMMPDSKICASPELRFSSDETAAVLGGGTFNYIEGGYESEYKYLSIPLDATEATLNIPCILTAREAGILPENWELPLHFVAVPPGASLGVTPIVVNTPITTPQVTSTVVPAVEPVSSPASDSTEKDRLSVLQVIDIGNSYIFVGAFTPPASPANEKGFYVLGDIVLRDGNGQVIEWQPSDLNIGPYFTANPGKNIWAIKFTKNFVPSVQFTYQTQYIYSQIPQDSYTFEFDAGANPQPGQEWLLNSEIQLSEHVVNLVKIVASANGYAFYFTTDDEKVESVGMYDIDDIRIESFIPINFAGRFGIGDWSLTKIYQKLPTGKMKITITGLYIHGRTENWIMDWQP